MQPGSGSSSKSDRNLVEKNRRMHMKSLCSMLASLILPQDSKVNLISGPDKKFMLRELISALEEEGAEVTSASHCTVGDKVSYIIHSQAISPRIGIEPSRVDERLKKLISLNY